MAVDIYIYLYYILYCAGACAIGSTYIKPKTLRTRTTHVYKHCILYYYTYYIMYII